LIRTMWVLLGGAVLTLVLATRVMISSWTARGRANPVCDRMARLWARILMRWAGARVEMEGLEKVDWDRAHVVIANHQSWFDVFFLMGYLPGKARFVGKEELTKIPIFGDAWKNCGHVAVDRTDRRSAISSLDAAGRRVRDERLNIVLFPEGTRSADGSLGPFKKGAFVLAIKTGVPVLPVAISGTRAVMAKGSFRIRPGRVRFRVGEPIPTEGLTGADRDDLLETSRVALLALMDEPDRALQAEETPTNPNEARTPRPGPVDAGSDTEKEGE
jgi:1-acyl-sn-glycerol-3-phosphate acyltransferase